MSDLCGAHHLSRVVLSELFCLVHFGIKYEDLKPNSRHLASSIRKRNHKGTNKQWVYHIIIVIEPHKWLYALLRLLHYSVNCCVNESLVSPRLTYFDVFLFYTR